MPARPLEARAPDGHGVVRGATAHRRATAHAEERRRTSAGSLAAFVRLPPARAVRRIKSLVFALALLPLARLLVGFFLDRLGANPIELITRSIGTWTLTFVLITLSITPLRRVTGWHWLLRLRRMCGLFAFFYGALHFTTYIWLDQFFDWSAIWKDLGKRRFIWMGFSAFILMLPLALTSTNRAVRKLGPVAWQRLHRLVYATAVCGVIHYWWLVKKDVTQPTIYACVLAALLSARVVISRLPIRRAPTGSPKA